MQILEYMFKHQDQEIYQKDLEKVLNLRRATVSGVLKTMEKNNLIERIIDSNDTRTKKIVLSNNAQKVFESSKEKIESLEKKCISGIN